LDLIAHSNHSLESRFKKEQVISLSLELAF
jgi:hypothetical protein